MRASGSRRPGWAALLGFVNYVGLPWYAKERSPVGRPNLVVPYVSDPAVPVVTYPRTCDSVAFAVGRKDFDPVRSKRYRDGDHDYNNRYGDRELYKRDYRAAFEQGYREGYGAR